MTDDITTSLASLSFAQAEALFSNAMTREERDHRHRQSQLLALRSSIRQQHGTEEMAEMALADAEEAIQLSPDLAVGNMQAGLLLADLKMFDSAETQFKMAKGKSAKAPKLKQEKIEEQITWMRFLQRLQSEEALSSENRLSMEQQILEDVLQEDTSFFELIPSEDEEVEEQQFFDIPANFVWNATSEEPPPKPDGCCELRVAGVRKGVDIDKVKRVFSRFGSIIELVKFRDKSKLILTFDNRESAVSAIAELNGKKIAGLCEDGRSLKMDILPKFKHHLRANKDDDKRKVQVNDKKPNENVMKSSSKQVKTVKMKPTNERPAKRSLKLEATDKTKPTNIFGLKAVWVRDLKLFADSPTIRIIFSRFGRVVRIGYSEGSSHAFVHFSDPESAVEAISAMNNQIIEGLSAGQKPVKMRFAPDKDQYQLYHSMSRNEYFQRVHALGECPGWRLSQCSKNCQKQFKHPPADYDIDCPPSRKQLLKR